MQIRLVGANRNIISAECEGPANAPLVIFAHGGGQTRHSWAKTSKSLAEQGYHVLRYDLRGHGESDWVSNAAYGIENHVADLEQVIRTCAEGRPVVLVGASLGGIASLVAASTSPDTVRAVAMVDVTPRISSAGADRIRTFMSAYRDGFETLGDAADAIASYRPGKPRSDDLDRLAKNLRFDIRRRRWFWHWDPALLDALNEDSRAHRETLMKRACGNVRQAVLLVRGLESDVVTDTEVDDFRQLLPQLEVADVAGAGHMVVGDRNDAFQAAVLEFLAQTFQRS